MQKDCLFFLDFALEYIKFRWKLSNKTDLRIYYILTPLKWRKFIFTLQIFNGKKMGSQKVGRFNVFIARMASAIAIANGSNEKVRHRFNKIATKTESTKKLGSKIII